MDRKSIERDLRAAEATLKEARTHAQTAAEAVEQRYEALTAEGGDVGKDDMLRTLVSGEESTKAILAEAEARQDTLLRLLARDPVAPAIDSRRDNGTWMDALENDPRFIEARKIASGGGALGVLPSVQINSRDGMRRSLARGGAGFFAVGEGATGESLIAIDQNLFPPVEIPRRQIRLLDLITIAATDSNLVRYGKQTVRTDAAAPEDLGVAFPNATYTWSTADAAVRNIGQYVKAPRETLLDIPALQSLVEQQLVFGVLLEAEGLVYAGDGNGDNYSGIVTQAQSGSYYIVRDTTNERRIAAVDRAIAQVRQTLFGEPDGFVIHPNDYHAMLVEESDAGGFLLAASRLATEQQAMWGLPAVVTPLATEGTVALGNFKLGATMWVRSGAELQMSDSNEDDFLKRLITLRAEFRAAFAVQRPHAFCLIEDFS